MKTVISILVILIVLPFACLSAGNGFQSVTIKAVIDSPQLMPVKSYIQPPAFIGPNTTLTAGYSVSHKDGKITRTPVVKVANLNTNVVTDFMEGQTFGDHPIAKVGGDGKRYVTFSRNGKTVLVRGNSEGKFEKDQEIDLPVILDFDVDEKGTVYFLGYPANGGGKYILHAYADETTGIKWSSVERSMTDEPGIEALQYFLHYAGGRIYSVIGSSLVVTDISGTVVDDRPLQLSSGSSIYGFNVLSSGKVLALVLDQNDDYDLVIYNSKGNAVQRGISRKVETELREQLELPVDRMFAPLAISDQNILFSVYTNSHEDDKFVLASLSLQ